MTTFASALPSPPAQSEPVSTFTRSRSLHNTTSRLTNLAVMAFCYLCAVFAISALLLIFGYIAYRGAASLDVSFFTALPPHGMRNGIAGTLVLIAMASCLGVPLGMLCGIYLSEYAGDSYFAHGIRLVVDVLAGVPSILVGVLGYEIMVVGWHPMDYTAYSLVNAFIWVVNGCVAFRNNHFPTGGSAWAGAIALGFMMCPIIARTTEEMLKLVPKSLREASIGLGASKFQTLFRVVVPAASSGIITGIMLAVARVAGETAPLLFTVIGSDQPVFSFDGTFPFVHADVNRQFPSLTVKIFQYANNPEADATRQMWAGLFILILIVLILNILVRVASSRKKLKVA